MWSTVGSITGIVSGSNNIYWFIQQVIGMEKGWIVTVGSIDTSKCKFCISCRNIGVFQNISIKVLFRNCKVVINQWTVFQPHKNCICCFLLFYGVHNPFRVLVAVSGVFWGCLIKCDCLAVCLHVKIFSFSCLLSLVTVCICLLRDLQFLIWFQVRWGMVDGKIHRRIDLLFLTCSGMKKSYFLLMLNRTLHSISLAP